MKRHFSLIFLGLTALFSLPVLGQETAIDFTQDDCEGSPHHLFSELDAGNVIVLEYVMLNCAPCINGTTGLEKIMDSYANSHPGRVHLYSFGFLNSYTCEQILAWKTDNSFTQNVFNNGEDQVDYYGGMGMPTIVVVGTNTHKVFYKSIGYTPAIDDDLEAAIDSALLYNPSGITETIAPDKYNIYPTAFTNGFNLETSPELAGSRFLVFDVLGNQVLSLEVPEDGHLYVGAVLFSKGMYFARLNSQKGISKGIVLIRQ
jgi:hypothetical protein